MKTFWEFRAAAPKKAELYLYGEIGDSTFWGDEVTPSGFAKDLAALGQIDQLDVFINSPGGSVFAGMAIYNILKRHEAKKTVHVDGLAASSASIVAMAGDRIVVPKSGTIMIHQAWAVGMGNKWSMRALADELDRLDGQLAQIYADRTGNSKDVITAWMESERWMSGDEALADGFCDEVDESKQQIAACLTPEFFAKYKHPPEALHPPRAEPDAPQAAEQGGFSMPDNGEETPQPVADKTPDTLADQRKHFAETKRKLLEV